MIGKLLCELSLHGLDPDPHTVVGVSHTAGCMTPDVSLFWLKTIGWYIVHIKFLCLMNAGSKDKINKFERKKKNDSSRGLKLSNDTFMISFF